MIKMVSLIRRKPGLSREEFVKHYEEVHAPLALKCFPTFKRYVRNHIIIPAGGEEPEFDCITELWYDDMQGHQAVIDFYQSEAGQPIRDDEVAFMDNSKTMSFFVEEKVSK